MNCECGCNEWVGPSKRFKQGHNSRKRSAEANASIGSKNSVHQKRILKQNPMLSVERGERLQAGRTSETEIRRISATKQAYDAMTTDDKRKFSEHASKLWSEQPEKMRAGAQKAAKTRSARMEQYRADGGLGSERWRQQISETITRLYVDGGFQWSRGEFTSNKSGETYYYRSSWELQRMMELDTDPEVLEWDYEPFSIPYTLGDLRHRYVPDFIVRTADGTWLEEVGPKAVKDSTEMNVAKRAAADKYCIARGFYFRLWEPTAAPVP